MVIRIDANEARRIGIADFADFLSGGQFVAVMILAM